MATANVSLYESVTATTTNATFYPQLIDKTAGNGASFTASTLTHNPSTGNLTATGLVGTHYGSASGLTSVPAGQLTGTIPSGVLGNSTHYIGTTAIALNRSSASQSLTGVNIDGSAGSATTATTATNQSGGTVAATTGSFSGAVSITDATASTSTTTGALLVTGGVGIQGALNATSKSFSIPHPTKPNKTLRYGSLEGPEFGIYVRGRLTNNNTIELPDYWTKLADPATITVQLTPIGRHQDLYIDSIDDNKVVVANSNLLGKKIDCFYIVYAERADIDKIVVEQ